MRIIEDGKIIWRYLGKYRKRVYLIMAVALFGSAIAATIPYIFGRLVDMAISETVSLSWIMGILGIWLGLSFVSILIQRWTHKNGAVIGVRASHDLFLKLINHVLKLPLSFHKKEKIGDINQRISRATQYLEVIIGEIVFGILPNMFIVAGILVIMAWIEWKLALVLVVVLAIYSLATIQKINPVIKEVRNLMKLYDKTYGDAFDSVMNAQAVKSNTNEEFEEQRIKENLKRIDKKFGFFINFFVGITFWQQIIFAIGFVLIFGSAIVFLRAGLATPGEIVMLVGYIFLAYQPFERLASQYQTFRQGITAMERALEILEEKPERYSGSIEIGDVQGKVEFRNVSFSHNGNGKATLKEINFNVEPGRIIAFVGESGGGKTTIADLILRFLSPDKGEILVDDCDIQKVNLKSYRENIAVVPQEPIMFNETIEYNIRYGKPNATIGEIIEASKLANADEFIREFPDGYSQLVGERGVKLSGGQKQRIAIARAILRKPKILIFDEATSSIDTISEKLIQESLKEITKDRTTFIIAHRLSTVVNADKILVLEKGKIINDIMTSEDTLNDLESYFSAEVYS